MDNEFKFEFKSIIKKENHREVNDLIRLLAYAHKHPKRAVRWQAQNLAINIVDALDDYDDPDTVKKNYENIWNHAESLYDLIADAERDKTDTHYMTEFIKQLKPMERRLGAFNENFPYDENIVMHMVEVQK